MLPDDGKPLPVGNRALDILIKLVEQAGRTVRKDELIAHAWPDTTVDEASLRVHVAALRKTLGDGRSSHRFITNVPGRGYILLAPTMRDNTGRRAGPRHEAVRGNDIPASPTRVGAPARSLVPGAAFGHEPRPAVAWAGAIRAGARAAVGGVRSVYRHFETVDLTAAKMLLGALQ